MTIKELREELDKYPEHASVHLTIKPNLEDMEDELNSLRSDIEEAEDTISTISDNIAEELKNLKELIFALSNKIDRIKSEYQEKADSRAYLSNVVELYNAPNRGTATVVVNLEGDEKDE